MQALGDDRLFVYPDHQPSFPALPSFTTPFLENQYMIENMANALFDVPIGNSGKVTVTEPAAKVYLVTFASAPDNRLTTVSSLYSIIYDNPSDHP